MKRFTLILPAMVFAVVMSGCGYHFGSIMHPEIRTIALGDVVNETTIYNASYELKQQLSEQFMFDGSLKVVSREEADCQLNTSLDSAKFVEIGGGSYSDEDNIYRPRQWKCDVAVSFVVIVPGEKTPLIARRTVYGSSEFQVRADYENARNNAVKLALRDAAQKVVYGTTMAW